MGFRCQYRTLPLLSRISLVKFLKTVSPKTGHIPQKCHSRVILEKDQAECLNFYLNQTSPLVF